MSLRLPRSPADLWTFPLGDLEAAQERHAADFVRLAGYDPSGLSAGCLALVFHSIARTEELQSGRRHNGHDWTLDYAGFARRCLRHEPYVDALLEHWHAEDRIDRAEPLEDRWPEGKRFALVLTHDVDHLVPSSVRERIRRNRHLLSAPPEDRPFLVGGLLKAMVRRASRVGTDRRQWQSLDAWMELESFHGFSSSFFFFGQPLPEPGYEDAFYRYDDTAYFGDRQMEIGEIIRSVAARGWDVGLHGSRRAHEDSGVLSREKELLEAAADCDVRTVRQHHLTFDVKKTPSLFLRAGLAADSSLGSNRASDFRCGTGLPFFYFDHGANRSLDVLSVPLIVQDVALFRVQQMDEELAVRHTVELMRHAAEHGGALTLLWHNSAPPESAQVRAYERILEKAAEMDAWGCSVEQLNDWWRKRSHRVAVG